MNCTSLYDALAHVYDLQHRGFLDDAPMYLRLAREAAPGASILEIGCGSGRVMIPLVEAGFRVVGVDESAEMLRIAEQRLRANRRIPAERWSLVHADARVLNLAESGFNMAIIALNTFLHNLSRDDQLATLRAARRHLAIGGLLVVDLPPNDELAYQPDDGVFQLEATLVDPHAGTEIHKFVASRIFWAIQEQELVYRIEERRAGDAVSTEQLVTFRLRHVFKHEMELLLLQSGFAAPIWYGHYDLSPYGEGSPRMIAAARAI
ncbi:MAG: class I SAM-dependent methyltransferase [Chloroflexi bacterium]|jgi:ubiquinone/menaquinone biosynthesis C-methylase UbiE|uniref:Class I SAM-dependent methyltransferase n=1 Tax=Candidatus Thermofonsia Clade 3 bacterium TaxID=2364212 RepID=A0A2M8QGM0_9CHLR|nr:class I SAM-dependent methyltransferase [Candidatus Roseilinea sp. NK_OTU-006]PJF48914.1 MAG: class I SAM-dependent methyltransferase [Candidatus Thermofonsia Clade 3 bacterium]RMG66076.1 MAG: class I SAM-dependent methyltransferase [Chloroflexota bacterium]